MNDWGAHHVDIACWALGAGDTGPSKVTPVELFAAGRVQGRLSDGRRSIQFADEVRDPRQHARRRSNDHHQRRRQRHFVRGDRRPLLRQSRQDRPASRSRSWKDNPLPEGAIEEVYGGPVSENHTANFIDAMQSRKQPISDVWSHNRMLEICHLSNIAMRLGRELKWDPAKREIVGDDEANSFLSRENRKGYEINM